MAKNTFSGKGEGRGCVSPLGGASTKPEIISGGGNHPVVRQSPAEAMRKTERQPDVRRIPRRP